MRRRRVAIFVSPVQPLPAERPRLAQGRTAVQETRDEPRSRSPLARSPWARSPMVRLAGPDRLSRGAGRDGTARGGDSCRRKGRTHLAARTSAALYRRHQQIGRAHVSTPVPNAHLVCRLLLEKTTVNTCTL